MRIGIVAKPDLADARATLSQLRAWLEARGATPCWSPEAAALLDGAPGLVVSRDDQRQAAIIEMTGLTTAQIPNMVVYFRDRFSQQRNIWSPTVNTPAARQRGLLVVFGNSFSQNLVTAITLFSASSARVASGCIGDARDTRSCGPR